MIGSQYLPPLGEVSFVAQSRGALSCAPGLWRGLAGLWLPNAGVQGSTLFDWSGYANAVNTTGAPGWSVGQYGTMLADPDRFLGGSALGPGSGDFTVASLCRTSASGSWESALWVQSGAGSELALLDQDNGTPEFRVFEAGYDIASGSTSFADGKWHTLVGVRRGGNLYVYVDGQEDGGPTANSSSVAAGGSTVIAEAGTSGTALPWSGDIASASVWNRALTPAEIHQLYTDAHCMTRLDRGRLGVFRAAAVAQNRRILKRILASELYVGGAL